MQAHRAEIEVKYWTHVSCLMNCLRGNPIGKMTGFLARRASAFIKVANSRLRSISVSNIADDRSTKSVHADTNDEMQRPVGSYCNVEIGVPRFFAERNGTMWDKCSVEVVDHDAWQVSSSLAHAWWESTRTGSPQEDSTNGAVSNESTDETEADFDVEDMRIRGKLFYKLEKDSKEFEEYYYEFRGKGSKKNKKEKTKKEDGNRRPKEEKTVPMSLVVEKQSLIAKFPQKLLEKNDFCTGKRIRTPTFNQLTGPYHEPFCLDIFISKGSVRACIVHRASSKVVAVAHSISKDIKFDIGSTKDAKACATVGRLLAQRALEDDIHNAIYTPRKGEKLEGKLLLVLQTVIENGVNIKLKIKQRKPKKGGHKFSS